MWEVGQCDLDWSSERFYSGLIIHVLSRACVVAFRKMLIYTWLCDFFDFFINKERKLYPNFMSMILMNNFDNSKICMKWAIKKVVVITHFGNTCYMYFWTFHLLKNIIIVHHIKCLKIYLVILLKIKLLCFLGIVSLIKSVLCKTYKQL